MTKGKALAFSFRKFKFNGSTLDSVFLSYESEKGQCLWILSPEDDDNPDLNPMLAEALPISNLDRIERESRGMPLETIFGSQPAPNWCYFFQKADLARQFKDWQEVSRLGDEAQNLGFGPNNPQEWMPFVEGYAMSERWEAAIETTQHVRRVNRFLSPRLCRLWNRILDMETPPTEIDGSLGEMLTRLECEMNP